MVQSPDGRPGPGNRGAERDRGRLPARRAGGRARPLPRAQERADAGAAGRPRPRDGHDTELAPRPAPGPRPLPPPGGAAPPDTPLAPRGEELERAELARALTEDVVDVTLPGDELPLGHLHPITQARRQIEDAFLGLGYEIRDDREVETVEYNF